MDKQGNKVVLLVVGTVMLLFLGLIYAWSIFRAPLTAIFTDWTPTQVSVSFSISIVCFCVGGFIAGKLAAVLKHRVIILISAAFILIGFVVIKLLFNEASPQGTLTTLYIFYGVFGGLGVGLSYNTLLGVIARWWPGRAGFASGVLLLGFGIGGLLLGSIVSVLTGSVGIGTTFLIMGVLLAVILFIGSFFVKLPAAPAATAAQSASSAAVAEPKSYSLKEAVSGGTFWMIFIWEIALCIGGLLVINSAAPIAARYGAPAVLGLIVSVFNGVGRPIMGTVFDAIGRNRAMIINTGIMVLGGIVLTLGATAESMALIFVGLLLMGICYGGTPTLLAASINRFFGPKNYQVILSVATFPLAIAAIIGPLLSSRLQESSGGEYFSSFVMIIIVGAIALVFTALLRVFSKKAGLE
jgi:OFA family oxalate/formate antiporter-like MFS transporter